MEERQVDPPVDREGPPRKAKRALVSLGVTRPSETPLLVPVDYEDFTSPWTVFASMPVGEEGAFAGQVVSSPIRSRSGPPRHTFRVEDAQGQIQDVAIFGSEPDQLKGICHGQSITFKAIAKDKGGRRWVTCKEVVGPLWVGRVRPVYPAPKAGGVRGEVLRLVMQYLPRMVGQAAQKVAAELEALAPMDILLSAVGCRSWTLEQLIEQMHQPVNMTYARHARRSYMRLAALAMRWRAYESTATADAPPIPLVSLEDRINTLPYTLTQDQGDAVRGIATCLRGSHPTHAVVSGDVGTGKSLVAYVLAASVADGPRDRALIMAPTYPLAKQLFDEFSVLYADIPSTFVAAESPNEHLETAKVMIGTSAVLSRDAGRFSLVIVDEQQRWSRSQREHYVASRTHLVEMSATCIPRTQALMRLGCAKTFEMRQTHAEKHIVTRLWEGNAGIGQMFNEVKKEVEGNHPVVVIYPKREGSGAERGKGQGSHGVNDRHAIDHALPRWERLFPGRVRSVTGAEPNEEKEDAIAAVADGRADVLLATTVLKVGISLPNLNRIVIVHPDRFGLTTLHQLRGRVARNGGEGYCDLWAPNPLSDKARARLDALVATTDGFAVAEADLRARGAGDLGAASSNQSGTDGHMVLGAHVDLAALEDIEVIWDALVERRETRRLG